MTRILIAGITSFCVSFLLMAALSWINGEETLVYPVVVASLSSLAYMFEQWRSDRAIAQLGVRPAGGANQAKELELYVSPEEAIACAKAILEDMPAIRELTGEGYSLQARRSTSGTGWGERITVNCLPSASGTTVTVTSKSLWRLHIGDLGENQLNVERLAKRLRESVNATALV